VPVKKLRLLLCSAGRRVGLLQCFRSAADHLGIQLEILACDLAPDLSAACAAADRAFAVPRCDDPSYANAILDIVRDNRVDLVVPTIDTELMALACVSDAFTQLGARVHVASTEVIEIVRDKRLTSEMLEAAGVPVPKSLGHEALLSDPDALGWPVFAKPSGGSASRGLQVFQAIEELPGRFEEPMVFQQFLRGPEYTINMFVDSGGSLRTVVPHLRIQIRAGEVEKGRTVRRDDFRQIAEGVHRALPSLTGVACFQVIDDPELGPRVIEINARFGGGYPLADHAGARFAQWLLEEVSGFPCSANDDWRENVKMLRYDSAIYHG
jgi:carbamoyl-phosphate synthase large subunit